MVPKEDVVILKIKIRNVKDYNLNTLEIESCLQVGLCVAYKAKIEIISNVLKG